jgi:hypothetical protein
MAQSIVKLSLESNKYEQGMRQAQKLWNDFTKGLGLSMGKFTAVGAAISAVSAALKVSKDAFFKNEQQLDEWNRTVESSKSVYSGFLNSLNNGDISGFLSNINTITEAARAAYDALDELSTFNAFNQIQTQKTRTGFTEAMAGFRLGENSKEDVQKAAKEYQAELRTRQKKEQEAYMQAVRKIAAERGVSWGGLEQALTGKYGDYETLKKTMPSGKQIKFLPGGQFGGTNAVEVPMAVTIQEKMGEALRSLNDTELKELQALGAQAYRTGEEIAQIDKQMARVLNGRQTGSSGSGGTGGGGRSRGGGNKTELTEMQQNQQTINTLTQEYVNISDNANEATRARQDEIQKEIQLLQQRNNLLKLYAEQAQGKLQGGDIQTTGLGSGSFWGSFKDIKIEGLSEDQMKKVRDGMASMNQTAKESQRSFSLAATAVNAMGSALGNIKDPGVQIMGMIGQAIASIALGFAQASAQEGKGGVWYWIAATAAGLATMVATISSIHSATGYAQGGIVEGNSYSGDNMMFGGDGLYGLNAGELVLTKSQQNSLAQQLSGNGMGNINVSGRISGTDILLSADRAAQASGRGQLVTWK